MPEGLPGTSPGAKRRLIPLAVALGAVVLCACGGRPPSQPAQGDRVVHPDVSLSVAVPDGWQVQRSRAGYSLVRNTPYGGGYPTFNVRVVGTEDLRTLRFDGRTVVTGPGRVEYRYEKWSNARGRGYRLEALVDAESSWLYVDASVWDPALSMDRVFFNEVFWPLLNAVKVEPE
jgi:hypothetical protein